MALTCVISEQEKYLIELIREARPFEIIEIHKDKMGKPDTYLVKRSQKILINEMTVMEIK